MRKANIVTVCLPEVPGDTTPEKNMERTQELLDSFKGLNPDLVCLPENFLEISLPEDYKRDYGKMTGMCRDVLPEKARMLNSHIVAGLHETIDGVTYTVAWLLDRGGNLVGRYKKNNVTDMEVTVKGVTPGDEVFVYDTDFGRLGILICFDIDYPEIWAEVGRQGAELVAWISAYTGGYPLTAYAQINDYYVVSSVRAFCSRIIDKSGRLLAESSKWVHWAYKRVGMDKTLFHMDHQFPKLLNLIKEMGGRITLESYDEEGRFMIESNDPEWPIQRIKEEFGLKTFKEYHDGTEEIKNQRRAGLI